MAAPITRVVVLGDPHGDIAALSAVFAKHDGPGAHYLSVGDNVGYRDAVRSSALCRRLMARNIPSVYGNHETWMRDGTLAIVMDLAAPRTLEADALEWCMRQPLRLDVRFERAPEVSIRAVHALAGAGTPAAFDFVNEDNALDIAIEEGAQIIVIGHSHGPRIYEIADGALVATHRLDLLSASPADVRVQIRDGRRYVVDAGSLGRPGYYPDPGRFDLATVALVDVERMEISLQAVAK